MNKPPSTSAGLFRVDDQLPARAPRQELAELDDDDLVLIGQVSSSRGLRQRLRTLGGLVAVAVGAVALFQLSGTWASISSVALAATFAFAFRRINRSDAIAELVAAGFEPALAAALGRSGG